MRQADCKVAEGNGQSIENFKTSGNRKFRRLDAIIGAALTNIAAGEHDREIILRNSHALGTVIRVPKGRELWYIATKYFATGNNVGAMYSMIDLQQVTLRGESLEEFQN